MNTVTATQPAMSATTATSATPVGQLYVVYMFDGGLFTQSFDAVKVDQFDDEQAVRACPPKAYGFCYATGPDEVNRISELEITPGVHYIDAIVIPSARLVHYLRSTGAYSDAGELLRNSRGAGFHAHTRSGRFFAFNPLRDRLHASTTREFTLEVIASVVGPPVALVGGKAIPELLGFVIATDPLEFMGLPYSMMQIRNIVSDWLVHCYPDLAQLRDMPDDIDSAFEYLAGLGLPQTFLVSQKVL